MEGNRRGSGDLCGPHLLQSGHRSQRAAVIDVGIYANSPVVAGVREAIYVLGARPSEVQVLSIGTTQTPYSVDSTHRAGGSLSWTTGIAPLFMHAQMDAANGQANLICGGGLTRINTIVENGNFTFDDVKQIPALVRAGRTAARSALDDLHANLQRFFDDKAM
jgi:hypothetical protein